MGKIKDNWQLAVFTVVITLIGSGLFTYCQNQHKLTGGAASIDYVEKRHNEQKVYADEQDKAIWQSVHKVENTLELKADKYHVESIEKKIDVIYEWVINNSKK